MRPPVIQVTIGADPPARLDKALVRDAPEEAGLSRSKIAKLIEGGAVLRNGEALTNSTARVAEGDVLEVTVPEAEPMHAAPEDIPLSIVHEDESVIVLNKPAGMVVHPAPGSPSGTLVNALLHHFGSGLSGAGGALRPGIVHRIDKDTTGLLVVAKSDAAHAHLGRQFEEHSAERSYLALCHGVPDANVPRLLGLKGVRTEAGGIVITTGLARNKTDRQRQAVLFDGGRNAVTRVRRLEAFADQAAEVECRLETGRTHQIRVHMAYVGHGLIGDQVYGGRRKVSAKALSEDAATAAGRFPRQALHAATLGFTHPDTGEMLRFDLPPPDDYLALKSALAG